MLMSPSTGKPMRRLTLARKPENRIHLPFDNLQKAEFMLAYYVWRSIQFPYP
jgi:hypothetical protein